MKKRRTLELRSRVIQAIRVFFQSRSYLEVETPLRIPAPIPEAHIDLMESEGWYLQPSPEICMKRLLSTGYSNIFQICKCFRAKERGQRHLPEFTMLEWYAQGATYKDMMDECEALIKHIASELGTGGVLSYQGKSIALDSNWQRISVKEAFLRYSSKTLDQALAWDKFDEIMGLEIEPKLGNEHPVFLYDYPACYSSLAKISRIDPSSAERFELYIAGLELCNAFTELTDVEEQQLRFHRERKLRESLGKTVVPYPYLFIQDLNNMPEASGNALGIDRLVMLFSNKKNIDDVVAFTPEQL